MMNKKCLRGLGRLGMSALLSCCMAVASVHAQDAMFDASTYQSLISDQRAFRVGDALTVLIQESAAASSTVDSSANRSTDLDIRGQLIGKPQRGLNGSVSSSSDGGGQTVRAGRVTGQITVTVREVLPNGEMLIQGQQTVDLNDEKQVISVSGRVRARDISENNSVLSSRIANAEISYNGQGYIAEKSQPSLLSRFFNFIRL